MRSAFVAAETPVDLPRRTFANQAARCPSARHADVVPGGGFFERLAESIGGCRFVAAGGGRAGRPPLVLLALLLLIVPRRVGSARPLPRPNTPVSSPVR